MTSKTPIDVLTLLSHTSWIPQGRWRKNDMTKCFNVSFIFSKVTAIYLISMLLLSWCCCDARHILRGSTITHQLDVLRVERSLDSEHSSSSFKPTPSLHSNPINPTLQNSNKPSPVTSASVSSDRSSNVNIPQTNQPPPADTTEADVMKRSQLIFKLISTLEELHVLEISSSSCLRLKKIVSKLEHEPWASQGDAIGVYLSFEKIDHNATQTINSNDSKGVLNSTDPQNIAREPSVLLASCGSSPTVEFVNTTSSSQPDRGSHDTGQHNRTVVGTVQEISQGSSRKREEDYSSGISRTQIVVISTCSTIIGIFFLVAAFLRIRNYIKRARMEQAMANRPKFRSCSVALRNPTQSMEQLRRDSLASKTSHQNSVSIKGSNTSQNNGSSRENSSSSSPHHEPDTTPLLIITRPGGLELATPTESNASFQCIDDEILPQKKKVQFSTLKPPLTKFRAKSQPAHSL